MLELDPAARRDLWKQVSDAVETYAEKLDALAVAPSKDPAAARALLDRVDFSKPMSPAEAVELAVEGLTHHQVHNGHPRYFGLFNPATTTMSIAADTLVAAFNPQLAAWTHAPFACEVEQRIVREIGTRLGYGESDAGGSFTTGGAEANHSALLMALTRSFPAFAERGVRALAGPPVFYVSPESHHSFVKASRLAGLGTKAVRVVGLDDDYRIDPDALARHIRSDREAGELPFMVVATLGTTGSGLVDPIEAIAAIGEREGLWVHADAAWGGAAALVPRLRPLFRGLERSDSMTVDAHKWLSVPMGAGMFLTRHPELLERTFAIDTGYMPLADDSLGIVEPHRATMQWTRRFIGLKLFLSMLVAGWQGYEDIIDRMVRLGDVLRERLDENGWSIVNRTALPVVCFRDGAVSRGDALEYLTAIAAAVEASGRAWLSVTKVGGALPALRACITNFRNDESAIESLIDTLADARASVS